MTTGPVAVGVDGSAGGFAAVEWGAAEAAAHDVPLWLVCAGAAEPYSGGASGAGGAGAARAGARAGEHPWPPEQLSAAHRLAAELHPSLKITEDAVCAAPVKALLSAAEEASVLVLGSRGLGRIEGFVLGSVGLSVIAHARRPVVAVRGRAPAGVAAVRGPVVAGVDLREGTDDVLEFAFRTAAAEGRDVRVAHAWSVRALYSYPSALPEPRMTARAEQRARQGLHEAVQPWRERFGEVGVQIRTEGEAVAPYLLEVGADAALLAVGRRLRGAPFPTRIGPVAHALLHHSPRPVAVIPHK
ncbi:universal stress protein [Streptomyces sp. Amel2xB2]|uniref:universal stress protein n=1 Tax=Streptomyces sp. Amel2xB2 TaxID=1305829 RepID=UPI0015EC3467|nr:universal stress protein [Streptomyces sp. Amel2xB2]